MPLARVTCRALVGLSAPLVHVEVSLSEGLPAFFIVGLPATVVKESKERVRAAIMNSGFEFPNGRITVNLAPADLPKEGGRFDLPIALGILLASEQLRLPDRGCLPEPASLAGCEFYGELALSGELKSTRGLLIAAAHASQADHELIVPRVNLDEAANVVSARVRGASHLLDVCAHVEGVKALEIVPRILPIPEAAPLVEGTDLGDIKGQQHAKRALTVAAAGGHSLLLIGVPGSGKSTLARCLPELLPSMSDSEALEVAAVASASSAGFDARSFGKRPFRSPHHTASAAALIGGGSRARPGEVSLAHNGVLFLDELPEFERRVLEALREPLETGEVSISRAALQTHYPAAFQLIAAMNPCPCGYRGDPRGRCHCTEEVVAAYRRRISGPLLDRLDLQIEVQRVPTHELLEIEHLPVDGPHETKVATGPHAIGDSHGARSPRATGNDPGSHNSHATAANYRPPSLTAAISARVCRVREIQARRQGVCNARIGIGDVMRFCAPSRRGQAILERASEKFGLSARGYHRILKVARTIADLAGEEGVREEHIAEAISLRIVDRGPMS